MVMLHGETVGHAERIPGKHLPEPCAPVLKARSKGQRSELLEMLGRPGQGGLQLAVRNAEMSDALLRDLFVTVGEDHDMEGLLMGAVGGYGRRLLGLRSDLDLCFLTDRRREEVADSVEAVMYPLWDAGISVGHQIVRLQEAMTDAHRELTMATELLDFRPLSGDLRLAGRLRDAFEQEFFVTGRAMRFIEEIELQATSRHEHFGDSVYLLEPDVKNGTGGLRDLDFALWAAQARLGTGDLTRLFDQGVLTQALLEDTLIALDYLWTVRNHLHRLAGRKSDRLTFGDQAQVARAMGYLPKGADRMPALERDGIMVETFMSDYYRNARAIARARDLILGRAKRQLAIAGSECEHVESHFLASELGVGFIDPADLRAEPALALELYRVALERGKKVLARSRDAIADMTAQDDLAQHLRDDPRAGPLFLELLTACREGPFPAGSILGELHDVGLLLAMIPEFSPVVGRVHHDLYHVYTVDVHSVAAVDRLRALTRGDHADRYPLACRLAAEVSRPKVLFMATLLHDVGKAIGGRDHARRGADMARSILPRFGFSDSDIEDVSQLILHHLTMYLVAVRRDLSDPHAIAEFARELSGREMLRDLYLLTVADVSTTSPTSMNKWKASMLNALFREADTLLSGDASLGNQRLERQRAAVRALCLPEDLEPVDDFLSSMPRRYLLSNRPEDILAHAQVVNAQRCGPVDLALVPSEDEGVLKLCVVAERTGATGLWVVAGDRPGLLAAIAAAISACGLRIRSAQVNSRTLSEGGQQAVDLFSLRADEQDGHIEEKIEKLRSLLPDVIAGRVAVDELIKERTAPSWSVRPGPPVRTEVLFDHHGSQHSTIIEVICHDRRGLLYTLSDELHRLGISICLAKISTEGDRVIDVFYVNESDGTKIAEGPRSEEVRIALLHVLGAVPAEDGTAS